MTSPLDARTKPPCHRADALVVLQTLRQAGHIAYFAGGCVRDVLLGRTPKDWDIATNAPPPRVRQLFTNTQAVGAAFGVILVRQGNSVVEVATFRSDGAYEDGRRPSSIRFTTAEEDAQRRDFTINGLFLDPLEDRVIDYVGGRADLEARRLRAIGTPAARFQEDHLRLLRAVRFAARFDFTIEPATAGAITGAAPRLKGISPERVGDELRLMLTPPTRRHAWPWLWDLQLAGQIFRFLPKLPTAIDPGRDLFLQVSPTEFIPFGLSMAAATLGVRMVAEAPPDILILLQRCEVSRSVRAMRQALRLSNEESDQMSQALANLWPLLQDQWPGVAPMKRVLANPNWPHSLALLQALAQIGVHAERIAALLPTLAELSRGEVAPAPLLTGDDLIAAGFPPGPAFKQILRTVYDAQLEGRICSKAEAMQLALALRNKPGV